MSYTILSALSLFNIVTTKSKIISLTQLSLSAIQWHKIKVWTNYKTIYIIH